MKKIKNILTLFCILFYLLSVVIASPNPGHSANQISAGTFSDIDGTDWVMPGIMTLLWNGPALKLESDTSGGHTFIEFYNDGGVSRSAWIGYGTSGTTDFTINNEVGTKVIFEDNVDMKANSNVVGSSVVGGQLTADSAQINNNVNVVGDVDADYFVGDGSKLENIDASEIINWNPSEITDLDSYISSITSGFIVDDVGLVVDKKWCKGLGTKVVCDYDLPINGDNESDNEIQDLSVNGNMLELSGDTTLVTVPYSLIAENSNSCDNDAICEVTSIQATGDIDASNLDLTGDLSVVGDIDASNLDLTGNLGVAGDIDASNLDISQDVIIDGNVGIGVVIPSSKLDVNGEVHADAFIYSSDRRLKNTISNIENPLEKIDLINGVDFYWNDDGSKDVGLIAQEVEKVLPEAVVAQDNGFKAVDYPKVVALLVEAIKEQQKEIDELKEICRE